MSDGEILALERRIATGDLAAWLVLDAALERAGRPPRRIWYVWFRSGEYSDRSEGMLDPVHATHAGAVKHLYDEAQLRGIPILLDDPERADGTPSNDPGRGYSWPPWETTLSISWSEVVP